MKNEVESYGECGGLIWGSILEGRRETT